LAFVDDGNAKQISFRTFSAIIIFPFLFSGEITRTIPDAHKARFD